MSPPISRGRMGAMFGPDEQLCTVCRWRRDAVPFHDADGRRWYVCSDCRPEAEAEKARTLEARRRARDAREREQEGQLRIDGTGDAAPVRARQEDMGL